MSHSAGVIGLKTGDVDKFPKHTFGATIHFYNGDLGDIDAIKRFCADMGDVYAITDNLSLSTRFAIPKRNLYMVPKHAGVVGLAERFEKKYGILQRADNDEDGGDADEPAEIAPLVYRKPVVSAPVGAPEDPLHVPLTWRATLSTGTKLQMRYPINPERLKVIETGYGQRNEYKHLLEARPGDVIQYSHSRNEPIANVEGRVSQVMRNYPGRLRFELEAHIHTDATYFLITTIQRSRNATDDYFRYRKPEELRKAMGDWEALVQVMGTVPEPAVTLAVAAHDSEIESTVTAVDETVEVPDSPYSMDVEWPEDWSMSVLHDRNYQYRPGEVEPIALIKTGSRWSYRPLETAKPGEAYIFDASNVRGYPADMISKLRYPVITYSLKCGYLIEAHRFGKSIVLYVTDIPYTLEASRSVAMITDRDELLSRTGGDGAPQPQPRLNRPVGLDVDFWKQIYAVSFQRDGDHTTAATAADTATEALRTRLANS